MILYFEVLNQSYCFYFKHGEPVYIYSLSFSEEYLLLDNYDQKPHRIDRGAIYTKSEDRENT
jgi:hypothetical protein